MKYFIIVSLLTLWHQSFSQSTILHPHLLTKQITNGIEVKQFDILCDNASLIQNTLLSGRKLQVNFEGIEGLSENDQGKITPNFSILLTSYGDTLLYWPELLEVPNSYYNDELTNLKPSITLESIPARYDLIACTFTLYDHYDQANRYNSLKFELNYDSMSEQSIYDKITSAERYTYRSSNGTRMFATKPFMQPVQKVYQEGDDYFLNVSIQQNLSADSTYIFDIGKVYLTGYYDDVMLRMDKTKSELKLINGLYDFNIYLGKKAELPSAVHIFMDGSDEDQTASIFIDIPKEME